MIGRLGRYARRVIKNSVQKRDLAKLPSPDTSAGALRHMSATELSDMMHDKALGAAWAQAETRTNSVIEVGRLGVGGVNPGDRRALYHLTRALNAQSFMEVGTNIGTSTRAIAMSLRENGAGEGAMVTVDIVDVNDSADAVWKVAGLPLSPLASLEALDLGDLVEFVVEDSIAYLAQMERHFDVIFLDGDHNAKAVYQEVPLALKKLNPGGIIILHDYVPGASTSREINVPIGPSMALDRLSAENPDLMVLPLGDLPWPTKNGSHRTTLAVVTRR